MDGSRNSLRWRSLRAVGGCVWACLELGTAVRRSLHQGHGRKSGQVKARRTVVVDEEKRKTDTAEYPTLSRNSCQEPWLCHCLAGNCSL
ncbi:hypothetical protein BDR03DRAFT_524723 [Suillus americanus]|nr:hypothetical protein BDR03DRAFT_524723 [Suillus americanus]